jgi:hypothetical protein
MAPPLLQIDIGDMETESTAKTECGSPPSEFIN